MNKIGHAFDELFKLKFGLTLVLKSVQNQM